MMGFKGVAAGFLLAGLTGPAWASYGVSDIGFDTQGSSVSGYCYFNASCPSGTWSGSGSGFINGQNSDWRNPSSAPTPTIVAFLQGAGSISQTFTASATAVVRLGWYDADRPGAGGQTYQVKVNGTVVATFSPTNQNFVRRYSAQFSITSGSTYTITFVGTNSKDASCFLDTIDIQQASETTSYSYDTLGRLTGTSHSGPVTGGQATGYQYDAADNRTQVTATGAPQ